MGSNRSKVKANQMLLPPDRTAVGIGPNVAMIMRLAATISKAIYSVGDSARLVCLFFFNYRNIAGPS